MNDMCEVCGDPLKPTDGISGVCYSCWLEQRKEHEREMEEDLNNRTKVVEYDCPRCGGKGEVKELHIEWVNCYKCEGRRTLEKVVIVEPPRKEIDKYQQTL